MTDEIVQFEGFDEPQENWSKLPHELIEALPLIRTVSELKVILYILRHTWGYREYDRDKPITNDEFMNGRKRKDGSHIDPGVGLSEPSIRSGVSDAEAHGFIRISIDSTDKARTEKSYRLNIRGEKHLPPEGKSFTPRGKKIIPRSEKDTLGQKLKKDASPNGNGRKQDPFYNAVRDTFNLTASGQIISVREMMLGRAKRGTWKDCNFDPPVTDAQEITDFGVYMRGRILDMNRQNEKKGDPTRVTDISAPVTIQRWFYDFRASRDAEHPVTSAQPTEKELKMRSPAHDVDADVERWLKEKEAQGEML